MTKYRNEQERSAAGLGRQRKFWDYFEATCWLVVLLIMLAVIRI